MVQNFFIQVFRHGCNSQRIVWCCIRTLFKHFFIALAIRSWNMCKYFQLSDFGCQFQNAIGSQSVHIDGTGQLLIKSHICGTVENHSYFVAKTFSITFAHTQSINRNITFDYNDLLQLFWIRFTNSAKNLCKNDIVNFWLMESWFIELCAEYVQYDLRNHRDVAQVQCHALSALISSRLWCRDNHVAISPPRLFP